MNRYRLSKAGIDANQGIRRLNNDSSLYETMLNRFLADNHFNELQSAVDGLDVEGAFAAAHSLKGVSGNLSFVKLHSSLLPLVEELRGGSLEHAQEYMKPVIEAYNEVVAAIKG